MTLIPPVMLTAGATNEIRISLRIAPRFGSRGGRERLANRLSVKLLVSSTQVIVQAVVLPGEIVPGELRVGEPTPDSVHIASTIQRRSSRLKSSVIYPL